MATYQELFDLRQDQVLLDKITVAVIVAADTIYAEAGGTANHANRLIWAREAAQQPLAMAKVFMAAVLAANKAVAASAISGASDISIQVSVDAVVDNFANGTGVLL